MLARRFRYGSPLAGLLGLLLLPGGAPGQQRADELRLEEALRKATADGKYEMLLRQIKVEEDAAKYSDFHDLELQERAEYAGYTELPRGYWVYVKPYWYIWRDMKLGRGMFAPRSWGPEQATGPPDTWPLSGDRPTAWASLTEDSQDEWLLLEYARPVRPHAVLVYATFNPGALSRVTAFKLDGTEVEIWKGKDPTPVGSVRGLSVIPVRVPFRTNRVKLFLASRAVGGWNEIDAVGLRAGGKTYWATAVEASSTYARQPVVRPAPVVDVNDRALSELEREVRQIKERVRKLEERIRRRMQKK